MKTYPLDKDEPAPSATPTRDQVALGDTWDLTLLYATPEAWQADFEKLQQSYEQIAQWKGRVGSSAQTLREVLEFGGDSNCPSEQRHLAEIREALDKCFLGGRLRLRRGCNETHCVYDRRRR